MLTLYRNAMLVLLSLFGLSTLVTNQNTVVSNLFSTKNTTLDIAHANTFCAAVLLVLLLCVAITMSLTSSRNQS